jgi:hypothetical protein
MWLLWIQDVVNTAFSKLLPTTPGSVPAPTLQFCTLLNVSYCNVTETSQQVCVVVFLRVFCLFLCFYFWYLFACCLLHLCLKQFFCQSFRAESVTAYCCSFSSNILLLVLILRPKKNVCVRGASASSDFSGVIQMYYYYYYLLSAFSTVLRNSFVIFIIMWKFHIALLT